MALLNMQRIYIYALKKDRKKLLELLQRRGVVETRNMIKEDAVFKKSDTQAAKAVFERNIASAQEALEILDTYSPEKKSLLSSFKGRSEVSCEVYDAFRDKYDTTVDIAHQIIRLSRSIAESKAEQLKYRTQAEVLAPWVSLDIPLDYKGTKHTAGFIGCLPKAWDLEALYASLCDFMPVHIEIISAIKDQTCIFAVCSRDKADGVYAALRGMDFSYPSISADEPPAVQLQNLKEQIKETEDAIIKAQDEIGALAGKREELKFLYDYETMRLEKYEVLGNLLQSKNLFIVSGFIPEKDAASLAGELSEKFGAFVETEAPRKKDEVPVLYRNNAFSAPLESVVNSYSPPGRGESDPTMVMSLFYYMLFGLMFSDTGYGLILALACGIGLLLFRNTMEQSMKRNLMMFMYCGIATVFWGIMFGSYFGDLPDVISTKFFGNEQVPVIPPVMFFPVEKPMLMLAFSMAIGIIHLFTGLGMKAYQLARQKDYKSIIYDVVFWYGLLISGIIILLSMEMLTKMLQISVSIPASVKDVAKVIAIICALGIILTNGRESKNPFKRFLKGLYALYGISGYLSDVLSYSRLLALGLATGVIASVVNKMAAMLSGPILFAIVVCVGHSLNFGINVLGAYVHTNRLQYVEFFGKFYEGGGKLFTPFGIHTKYYKVKEKMNNGSIE